MNLANEGLEAKRKEEEVVQRKRKAEDDKSWEGALQFFSCVLPPFTSGTEQKGENIV
jgi:hypothetical protein